MKKKILAFILAAASCLTLTACKDNKDPNSGNSGTGNSGTGNSGSGNSGSNETISLTVWGAEEDQALLTDLVNKFKQTYTQKNFDIKIGVESESTAKDTILTDVSAAADVFAFASDQLDALVSAKALLEIDTVDAALKGVTGKSVSDIKSLNTDSSVNEATKDNKLYAFPLGSGNNFFMYYDKTKVSEEDVKTWDGLLAAAAKSGDQVGMVLSSGWYNGGFFIGAGFTVSMNSDKTTNCEWNKTSLTGVTGVQVTEAMLTIAGNPAFRAIDDNDISNQIAAGGLCAVVSGSWDMGAVEEKWGAGNVGAAKLPTFTVGDKQIQQGTFSGYKLMGVNAMSKETGWAAVLAEFLTNEESQAARYASRQLLPTNIKAGQADAVVNNYMIAASMAQDAACSVVQNVGDNYWSPTKTFGEIVAQGQLKVGDTAAIQKALDDMVAGVTAPIV